MTKRFEDLEFTDVFMFCKLLQNNPDVTQAIVELLTGKKIGGIVNNERQRPIEITPDGKGVRMDVYLRDDNDVVYNIEMQKANVDDIPRRARYYQSMIDVDLIERGMDYKRLNDSYVIFIMLEDPFGSGEPIYTFNNICDENPDLKLGDGTVKIFVNAQGICGKINNELRSFIEYLRGDDASSILTRTIDERINRLKRNERWRGEFMTLYENYQYERNEGRKEGREEGLAEGRKEGCKEAYISMVKEGAITPAYAADKLEMSEEEFNKYL
ncbi:MAG: Rpn family recombination-promoting nuclease/putative transposase [Clostridiales bacterium]|nr:Rpn family recombination-promoting nuclease/putative transposase [Candidatus Crickella equi]